MESPRYALYVDIGRLSRDALCTELSGLEYISVSHQAILNTGQIVDTVEYWRNGPQIYGRRPAPYSKSPLRGHCHVLGLTFYWIQPRARASAPLQRKVYMRTWPAVVAPP